MEMEKGLGSRWRWLKREGGRKRERRIGLFVR